MIPHVSILNHVRFDLPGITHQLSRSINWFAIQIDRELAARAEKLKNIRPGAVSSEETVIIWMELFESPLQNRFLRLNRNKFNKGVNDMALQHTNVKVMEIKSLSQRDFDFQGNLTYQSKMNFWREVDEQLHLFHLGHNELLP